MADGTVIIKIKGDTKEYESAVKGIAGKTEQSLGTAIKGSMIGNLFANAFSSAAGVISSSMDKAISRVDTLNRFPKVMASIGYSADDAKAAINRMSDHIQGLPTTLDSIVSSTQRVVSSVGDVGKATDIMLAFNDALVAGGQSSQVQEAAMEQFVQGISKGKFELEEWRSITTAMPGPIDQVAKSILGADGNANKLYDAMKDGKVSVEDFTNAFVNLDKDGLNGLASFAEQAQTGAGGIQTSMENAANAVAVQVGKIIDKLNENGEITSAFNTMKQVITDAGGQISNAIGWIKDNFDSLAPAAVAIVSLVGAYKAWGLAVDTVATAHKILDAVMSGSKIGIIIGLVAALVGALITAYNTNEDFRNAVNTAWETISGVVGGVVEGIVGFFQRLGDAFTQCGEWFASLPDAIKDGIGQIGDLIGQGFQSVVDFFTVDIPNAFNSFIAFLATIPEAVMNFVSMVVEFFMQLPYNIGFMIGQIAGYFILFGENLVNFVTVDIPNFITSAIEWFTQLPGLIWDAIVTAVTNFAQWCMDIYTTVSTGITNLITNVYNWFVQLPGRIWDAIVTAITNLAQWCGQLLSTARDGITNLINSVFSWLSQLPGRIWSAISSAPGKMAEMMSNMTSRAAEGAGNVVNSIINGLMNILGQIGDVGHNIVEGLWNGITGAAGWIQGKVGEFAQGILDGMKNALGIHSPSKRAQKEVGRFIPEGIAVSFDKDKSALTSIKALVKRITTAAQIGLGSIPISFGNAQAKLSGLTTETILGDAFMQGIDAVVGRLDSINERLKSIEDKMDRDGAISINGREFARLIKEYQ